MNVPDLFQIFRYTLFAPEDGKVARKAWARTDRGHADMNLVVDDKVLYILM